uniref:Uncharacterized protein n=1 Tax=Panagrolaimus sp. JU765 TaxID=591449 RepID=A0AC34RLX2_9BILA
MSNLTVSSSDLFEPSSQLIQTSDSSQMDSEATLSSASFTFYEKQPISSFKILEKQESEIEYENFLVSGGEVVVSDVSGGEVVVSDGCIDICDSKSDDFVEQKKYLDPTDVDATKRILGKLLNEIEDNSRHHQIKINELSNLPFEEEIEDALFGVQIALDEASIDIAEKFNQKLE